MFHLTSPLNSWRLEMNRSQLFNWSPPHLPLYVLCLVAYEIFSIRMARWYDRTVVVYVWTILPRSGRESAKLYRRCSSHLHLQPRHSMRASRVEMEMDRNFLSSLCRECSQPPAPVCDIFVVQEHTSSPLVWKRLKNGCRYEI